MPFEWILAKAVMKSVGCFLHLIKRDKVIGVIAREARGFLPCSDGNFCERNTAMMFALSGLVKLIGPS